MKSSSLLVLTKFSPPRIPASSIARQALLARLHAARHGRLVIIKGGAGFGKTTLLAQWRQHLLKEARVAWLSLTADEGACEPFCAHLLGTLQQLDLPLENDLLLLGETASTSEGRALGAILINAISRLSCDVYLMLDDFHHAIDPAISHLLQALLDAAPTNLHLVIATRSAPQLLLGRLRAMGELFEVGGNDLAFAFTESLSYLKGHLDSNIDLDAVHSLHGLTDGWPIGLQLASIALKGNPRKHDALRVPLGTSAELGAYLSEDVVTQLPGELLSFMEQLSILRRFNTQLAIEVSGSAGAAERLTELETQNLFLQRVDQPLEDPWYRFHPMFAEFLSQRLQQRDADVTGLHRRAAQWLCANGAMDEAMHHALYSADFELVVQLLQSALAPELGLSHMAAFQRWMRQVPQVLLSGHPQLLLHGVWCSTMTARTVQAERWLDLLQRSPAAADFQSQIALARGMIALQYDDFETALGNLPLIDSQALATPLLHHLHLALRLSCLTMLGRHADARAVYNAPQARDTRTADDDFARLARNMVTMIVMHEGNVPEAERIALEHLEEAENRQGRRSIAACACAALAADALYELDRLDEARETLAHRLDMLHLSTLNVTLRAVVCHARLLFLDNPRAAFEYLAGAEAQFRQRDQERGLAVILAQQIDMALASNDWHHAENLQHELQDLARRHDDNSIRGAEIIIAANLSTARLALYQQAPEQCLQALATCEQLARKLRRAVVLVRVQLLRVLALIELGQHPQAHECLRGALATGYRHGLVRTFLDEGERLRSVLLGLGPQLVESLEAYRLRLVDSPALPAYANQRAPEGAAVNESPALTPREREILDLLQQSMSNKRIALALNISAQTVKWNLSNIFSKLNVSSRYDACLAARRLD